jgi:predicted HAD superfamily Cof-like phosphohydrolase
MAKRSEEYGLMVGDTPSVAVRRFFEPHTEAGSAFVRKGADPGFDPVFDIEEFHKKFAQAYNGPPRTLPADLFSFRDKFLGEEHEEYGEGHREGDKAKQLDALVDLVYVALGTSYLHGFDFREAWRRVHRANMSKVLANPEGDTRSHRDVKFDIVKPEGWLPPNHDDLVV